MNPLNTLLAPPSITTTPIQNVSPHTTVLSTGQEIPLPLFTLQQTPAAQFLNQLYQRGVINEHARVIVDLSHLDLPFHIDAQMLSLAHFLKREFLIECGEKQIFINYIVHALISLGVLDTHGNLIESLPVDPLKELIINEQTILLHEIVQALLDRNIITLEGKLSFNQTEEFLQYSGDFNPILWKFINKEDITLEIGSSYYCCCYTSKLDLCSKISNNLSLKENDIILFGGQARRRLLESKEFCEIAFHKLFQFLNQDTIENLVLSNKKSNNGEDRDVIPDTDIKFLVPGATSKSHLFDCTDKIIEIFSSRFFKSKDIHQTNWLKNHLFIKLNVKSVGFNEFAIAAFGKHANEQVEFLFVNKMLREFVFTDEIEESINDVVKGERKPHSFSSPNLNGWQSLIDNQGEIFHLDNPHQLDVHVFYHIITRMIRGKLFCSVKDFKTIVNNTLEKNRYANIVKGYQEKDIPNLIADLVLANIKHHHPFALPHAPLVYAFTACNFFQQHLSDQNIKNILTLIFEDYSLIDLKQTTFPFLQHLADALTNDIPFSIISELMNLAGLLRLSFCQSRGSHSINITIEEIESSPIFHFEFINSKEQKISLWNFLSLPLSIEKLIVFLTDPNTAKLQVQIVTDLFDELWTKSFSENFEEPILAKYIKIRQLDIHHLTNQAENLLDHPNRFVRYLGYFIFLTLQDNHNVLSIPLLLQHYPEAFTFRNNISIKNILCRQIIFALEQSKYSGFSAIIRQFSEDHLRESNSKQVLNVWICSLSDYPDELFCNTALTLWKKYGEKYVTKTYQAMTLKLFRNFLTYASLNAVEILKYTQKNKRLPINIELKLLDNLLHTFKSVARSSLLLNLANSMSSFFDEAARSSINSNDISEMTQNSFVDGYVWLIRCLIKEKHFDLAISLLIKSELRGLLNTVPKVKNLWLEVSQNAHGNAEAQISNNLTDLIIDTNMWQTWDIEENFSSLWIKLCTVLTNKKSYSEAISIWERLCAFDLKDKKFNALCSLTGVILENILKTKSLNFISHILKILQNDSQYGCPRDTKMLYLHLCLKEPSSNILELFENFLNFTNNNVINIQEAQFFLLFLKSEVSLNDKIKDKIRIIMTSVGAQFFLKECYYELCCCQRLLKFHEINLLNDNYLRNLFLHAYTDQVSKQGNALKIRDFALEFIHSLDQITEIEEDERLPLVESLFSSHKTESAKSAALFFLNETTLLFKALQKEDWNVEVMEIANQLSNKNEMNSDQSIQNLKLAIKLLHGQNLLCYKLWTQILEFVFSLKDNELNQFTWSYFKDITARKEAENSNQAALCWYYAIGVLNYLSNNEIIDVFQEAINQESKLSYVFRGSHKLNFKIKTWKLILMSFLGYTKEKEPRILSNQISDLRSGLPNYLGLNYSTLKELMEFDIDILRYIKNDGRFNDSEYILWPQVKEILSFDLENLVHVPENADNELPAMIREIIFLVMDIISTRGTLHKQNLFSYGQEILLHQYANVRFEGASYSHFLGIYAFAYITYHESKAILEEKFNFIVDLLDHRSQLKNDKQIEEICLTKCVDLILDLVNQENFIVFHFLILKFFTSLYPMTANPKESDKVKIFRLDSQIKLNEIYASCEKLSAPSKYLEILFTIIDETIKIPTIICALENQDPYVTEFRNEFYKYMVIIFKRILTLDIAFEKINYFHCFMGQNIIFMIKHFPKHKKEIAVLIQQFFYHPPFLINHLFQNHWNFCRELLIIAFKAHIFDDGPTQYVQGLFFIRQPEKIPLYLLMHEEIQINAYKIIEHLIAQKSKMAACLSLEIMGDVAEYFNESLKTTYLHQLFIRAIENSRSFFYNIVKGNPFCDKAQLIFSKIVPNSELYFQFFEIAFQEYEKISLNSEYTINQKQIIYIWFLTHFAKLETINLVVEEILRNKNVLFAFRKYYNLIDRMLPTLTRDLLLSNHCLEDAETMTILISLHSGSNSSINKFRDNILFNFLNLIVASENLRAKEICDKVIVKCEDVSKRTSGHFQIKKYRQHLNKLLSKQK